MGLPDYKELCEEMPGEAELCPDLVPTSVELV